MKNPVDLVWAKLNAFGDGFFLMLPNLVAGAAFLGAAYFLGKYGAKLTARGFHHRRREDLGAMMGSLVKTAIYVMALLMASAIIFPSVKPGDILAALGFGSVAVGFAFKDILQNLFAGLLLLIQRPYRRGDQIKVKGFEGTIEHIESRATLIKTYDGRRVLIPNSDLYTAPVIVNTAFPTRRDFYDIGIGYGDDAEAACTLFEDIIAKVDGVMDAPAPEVLPWGLDASQVTIRARWWTESLRTKQVHVRARVLIAIYKAAKEHGVDLPYPTNIVLFHDQTEETDGDRGKQREGWPSSRDNPAPRALVINDTPTGGDNSDGEE